jgi:hypothetical protein
VQIRHQNTSDRRLRLCKELIILAAIQSNPANWAWIHNTITSHLEASSLKPEEHLRFDRVVELLCKIQVVVTAAVAVNHHVHPLAESFPPSPRPLHSWTISFLFVSEAG